MSLLRLLTNSKVMAAEDLLTPESVWLALMTVPAAKGSVWTDAWLAAFALTQGVKLVSFDSGMRRSGRTSARSFEPNFRGESFVVQCIG